MNSLPKEVNHFLVMIDPGTHMTQMPLMTYFVEISLDRGGSDGKTFSCSGCKLKIVSDDHYSMSLFLHRQNCPKWGQLKPPVK